MVKIFFTFILLISSPSFATYYVSVYNNSWQDAIPVSYTDSGTGKKVSIYALTTFSTLSVGGGYEGLYKLRWRYSADLYIHSGTADILKIQGTTTPRKTISSQWVTGKISYRLTKTYAIGTQIIMNAVRVPDAGNATSLGVLINSELDMFDNLRLIQTIGTMNNSGTIAYSLGVTKIF